MKLNFLLNSSLYIDYIKKIIIAIYSGKMILKPSNIWTAYNNTHSFFLCMKIPLMLLSPNFW